MTSKHRAAVLILFAILIFPKAPLAGQSGRDGAWMAGLNMAHARHMMFGDSIAFTYGPLAYLSFPTFPEAEPGLVLLYTLGMYGLLILAAWEVLCCCTAFQAIAALFTCAAGAIFLDLTVASRNIFRLEAVALLSAIAVIESGRRRALVLLAFITGLAAVVKFSMAVELILLTLYCWWSAGNRVRSLAILLIAPATALLLFISSQGSATYFGRYVKCALELISGYPAAMSLAGSERQLVRVGLALVALFVGTPLISGRWRSGLLYLAPAAVVAFFGYKNFVVRQDPAHMPIVFFELGLAAVMLVGSTPSLRNALMLGGLCVALNGLGAISTIRAVELTPRDLVQSAAGIPRAMISYLRFGDTARQLQAEYGAKIEPERMPEPFLRRIGRDSVDIIPDNILAAQASGVEWNPRPIFQSYSVYTPYLDRTNRDHIVAYGAARTVLSWSSVDGRIPFLDEPLVWRALLDHYDFEYQTSDLVLLRRRNQPKFGEETPEGELTASWGQTIQIPESQPGEFVVMRTRISGSLAGSMINVAFRPEVVTAAMTFASGVVLKGRVIPANLDDGWIVSPFPSDQERLGAMFGCDAKLPLSAVRSIRLETPAPWQFQREFRVRWSRLRCNP